jgi:hypothetical protein
MEKNLSLNMGTGAAAAEGGEGAPPPSCHYPIYHFIVTHLIKIIKVDTYTVKKVTIFPSPARMSPTKHSLAGNH